MTTNLYVPDVAAEAAFFTAIGFSEVDRQELGGTESIVLAPDQFGNARLQIFDKAFIKAVSPEVADSVPSVLFSVPDLEAFHQLVSAQHGFTSAIQDLGDRRVFNFQAPSGTYLAATGN